MNGKLPAVSTVVPTMYTLGGLISRYVRVEWTQTSRGIQVSASDVKQDGGISMRVTDRAAEHCV